MDLEYQKFQQGLYQQLHFDLSGYKPRQIKDRILRHMQSVSCETFMQYLKMLVTNKTEFEHFLNEITVNTSEFFRDASVFSFLGTHVFPEVARKQYVRIWSAGCSIGAEAYSIAMIMRKLGLSPRQVHILGSDINPRNLMKAKNGIYKENHIRNVPKDLLAKGFHRQGDEFHIVDEIKEYVTFRQHDLLTDVYLPSWDMIFCRNVLIYLTQEAQERILQKFCDSLKTGGYIVIGSCEQIFDEIVKDNLKRLAPAVFQLRADKGHLAVQG